MVMAGLRGWAPPSFSVMLVTLSSALISLEDGASSRPSHKAESADEFSGLVEHIPSSISPSGSYVPLVCHFPQHFQHLHFMQGKWHSPQASSLAAH